MLRFLFISLCCFFILSIQGCSKQLYNLDNHQEEIIIDGEANESVWKKCKAFTLFVSPWNENQVQETSFRSYYNEKYFFFHFDVTDEHIHCSDDKENDNAVEYSDRVELFFSVDSTMNQYCGLEYDARGRLLQFFSNGYRNFEKDWFFPGLDKEDHRAVLNDKGYKVEGRIPLKGLQELGFIKDNQLHLGVFRADRFSKRQKAQIIWISWKNINTEKPDFHIFQGFRSLKIEGLSPKKL